MPALAKISWLITLLAFSCVNSEDARFSLLHISDINGQLEQFQKGTDPPKPLDHGAKAEDKSGGLPEIVSVLKKYENMTVVPVFRVSTGNLVGGPWLSLLKWTKYAEILKKFYQPKYMSICLNEFASGLNQTNEYLAQSTLSTIISNIRNDTARSSLKQLKEFDFLSATGNVKIGVVGFVHPLVMNLSDPGNLVFDDVITELKRVIDLKDFSEVKSVIAIGNGNSELARQILDQIPKVKLVMYSHSHGLGADDIKAYPEPYKNGYIAYSPELKYGASVGNLNFTVAEDGKFSLVDGSGLLKVDSKVEADLDAEKELGNCKDKLKADLEPNLRTFVKLDGSKNACWRSGCNLGNLVADAMLHCAVNHTTDDHKLIGAVAIWHSWSIHDNLISPAGNFSISDAQQWLPFQTKVFSVSLKGSVLKQLFTISAEGITANNTGKNDWGQFLQVSSGLEVHYSSSGEFQSLKVLRSNESSPVLEDVQDDQVYPIIMPSTLYDGRNGYDSLKSVLAGFSATEIETDDKCLQEYIGAIRIFKNGFEKRTFIGEPEPKPCPKCSGSNTATTVVLTLVIFIVIVAICLALWLFAWPRFQTWRRSSSFP